MRIFWPVLRYVFKNSARYSKVRNTLIKENKKKEKRKLMAWIRVYGGQRSLAFELTILSFFFWKLSCKCPMVGTGVHTKIPMPLSGTTPKLYFPVNKLQKPHLWISNNLIKTCEAPYANCP